jgi:hypothetical protein
MRCLIVIILTVYAGAAQATTVDEFWARCLPSLSAPPADAYYRVRSIGSSPQAQEIITKLILAELKTGTFSSPWMYEGDRAITPVVGGYSVLVDSTDTPRAVLKTTALKTMPFHQITEKETAILMNSRHGVNHSLTTCRSRSKNLRSFVERSNPAPRAYAQA